MLLKTIQSRNEFLTKQILILDYSTQWKSQTKKTYFPEDITKTDETPKVFFNQPAEAEDREVSKRKTLVMPGY